MVKVPYVRTHLEMLNPSEARLAFPEIPGLSVDAAGLKDAETCQRLYREIGREHLWILRLAWSKEDYESLLASSRTHVWLAKVNGVPVGLVELCEEGDGSVQLVCLGVEEGSAGRGIGKYLLSYAVREAWKLSPHKVWLHTRTYDGAYAMANYLKRGFNVTQLRPMLTTVPVALQADVPTVVARAKERGVYPSLRMRLEALLRESLAWRFAALVVRGGRGLLGRAKSNSGAG